MEKEREKTLKLELRLISTDCQENNKKNKKKQENFTAIYLSMFDGMIIALYLMQKQIYGTKYGNIRTNHILMVYHKSSPNTDSDLELQNCAIG